MSGDSSSFGALSAASLVVVVGACGHIAVRPIHGSEAAATEIGSWRLRARTGVLS
jgi:hypothetical protein